MSWRRFTEGRVGALSARQYTEVQDAVRALLADLGARSVPALARPQPMLIRITERLRGSAQGGGSTTGSSRVDGAIYAFKQLHVRVTGSGIETAARDYGITSDVGGGMDDGQRAVAIDLTKDSDIAVNTVVTAYPAAIDMGEDGNEVPQAQSVWIIANAAPASAVDIYTIVSAEQATGMYTARSGDGGTVQLQNLYETSDYYGASLTDNPCAQLVAGLLPPGSRVLALLKGDMAITCAPTPFGVTCTNCGTNPGGALAEGFTQANGESGAASLMLGG